MLLLHLQTLLNRIIFLQYLMQHDKYKQKDSTAINLTNENTTIPFSGVISIRVTKENKTSCVRSC